MIHIKRYKLLDNEDRLLLYEEIKDNGDKVLGYKDHRYPGEETEGFFIYDDGGRLLGEREVINGKEVTHTTIAYDEEGRPMQQQIFLLGELSDEYLYTYKVNSIRTLRLQENEVISDWEEVERQDGDAHIEESFDAGRFAERTSTVLKGNLKEEVVEDASGLVYKGIWHYDDCNRIICYEKYDGKGELLRSIKYQYENDLLSLEEDVNYYQDTYLYTHYAYDNEGRQIREETTDTQGNPIRFHFIAYDEQGRIEQEIIRESGYLSAEFWDVTHAKKELVEYVYS